MEGSLATGRHGNCEGKLKAHVVKQKQEAESMLGKAQGHPSLGSISDRPQSPYVFRHRPWLQH